MSSSRLTVCLHFIILILLSQGCPSRQPRVPAQGGSPTPSSNGASLQAFSWRTLLTPEQLAEIKLEYPGLGRVAAGRFDKSTRDEQLLAVGQNGALIVNAQGQSKAAALSRKDEIYWAALAWDCNGDGIDELVLDERASRIHFSVSESKCAVVSLDGKVTTIDSVQGSTMAVGEFLNDGRHELILFPYLIKQPTSIPVFGRNAEVVGHLKLQPHETGAVIADTDGDGCDELCRQYIGGSYPIVPIVAYSLFAARREVVDWPASDLDFPEQSSDLSGDKQDDLVGHKQYWNSGSGQIVEMQPTKPDWFELVGPMAWFTSAQSGASFLVARPLGGTAKDARTIVCFDLEGKEVHTEKLAEEIESLQPLQADGRFYVVVYLKDRVMIYP
jgi:hypothetical protein